MPTVVSIKNVKAADPGLGFLMEISGELAANFKVNVTINDGTNHLTCSLVVHQPVTDKIVNLIMPFGDAEYRITDGSSIGYDIEVISHNGTNVGSKTGTVIKNHGLLYSMALHYELLPCADPITESEKVLWGGQMMASVDGGHVGILQNNGIFCIFPTDFNSIGDRPVDCPSTPPANQWLLPRAGLYLSSDDGYIYLKDFTPITPILICRSLESVLGGKMIISDGEAKLKDLNGIMTTVHWTTDPVTPV